MEYLLFALIIFTLFLCVLLIRLIEAVQIISGKVEVLIDAQKEGNRIAERALFPMHTVKSGPEGFMEKVNDLQRTSRGNNLGA